MTFKQLVETLVGFGDQVVALMYALAFIFFLFGIYRYMFTQGAAGREKGKQFILWGLIGFVVLFGVWGFVHLLLASFVELGT